MWEKKSNWDMAVRVPLMIKVPGKPAAVGQVTVWCAFSDQNLRSRMPLVPKPVRFN
jgi:hypothetical protein